MLYTKLSTNTQLTETLFIKITDTAGSDCGPNIVIINLYHTMTSRTFSKYTWEHVQIHTPVVNPEAICYLAARRLCLCGVFCMYAGQLLQSTMSGRDE